MLKYIIILFFSVSFLFAQSSDPMDEYTIRLKNGTEVSIGDKLSSLSIDYENYHLKEKSETIVVTESFAFKIRKDDSIWQIQLFDDSFSLRNGIRCGDNIVSIYTNYSNTRKYKIAYYEDQSEISSMDVILRKPYKDDLESSTLSNWGSISFIIFENIIEAMIIGIADP